MEINNILSNLTVTQSGNNSKTEKVKDKDKDKELFTDLDSNDDVIVETESLNSSDMYAELEDIKESSNSKKGNNGNGNGNGNSAHEDHTGNNGNLGNSGNGVGQGNTGVNGNAHHDNNNGNNGNNGNGNGNNGNGNGNGNSAHEDHTGNNGNLGNSGNGVGQGNTGVNGNAHHDKDNGNNGNGSTETPTTPDVPETPETPVTPDTPDVPETPETPVTPDTPDVPETPETPVTPDTPDVPETPETPVTPDTPDVPETPETPEQPENPETPEAPATVPEQKPKEPYHPKFGYSIEAEVSRTFGDITNTLNVKGYNDDVESKSDHLAIKDTIAQKTTNGRVTEDAQLSISADITNNDSSIYQKLKQGQDISEGFSLEDMDIAFGLENKEKVSFSITNALTASTTLENAITYADNVLKDNLSLSASLDFTKVLYENSNNELVFNANAEGSYGVNGGINFDNSSLFWNTNWHTGVSTSMTYQMSNGITFDANAKAAIDGGTNYTQNSFGGGLGLSFSPNTSGFKIGLGVDYEQSDRISGDSHENNQTVTVNSNVNFTKNTSLNVSYEKNLTKEDQDKVHIGFKQNF